MLRTLFISDLHLCDSRPQITQVFLDFLGKTARGAQALYILGDLFEYWAGDDELLADAHHQQIVGALHELVQSGTSVFVMHGNRDLLIGSRFEAASGVRLLPDPVVIDLYGRTVLLTHGDLLCTDDVEYQAFRQQVHKIMRASYSHHYRRMVPELLEILDFRSNNELYSPIISSIQLVKDYVHSPRQYYPNNEIIPSKKWWPQSGASLWSKKTAMGVI